VGKKRLCELDREKLTGHNSSLRTVGLTFFGAYDGTKAAECVCFFAGRVGVCS
jgi:hypothetical protein